MSGSSNFEGDDISVKITEKSCRKATMSIENSGQKDIVLQLMFTTTDAFNVNPSKGRVKGKEVQLFSVDRLSKDRELDLVVLFKEWNAEVPEEVKCWHCSFEDETAQTHMVPVKIIFYRNRLEEMFCKFWKYSWKLLISILFFLLLIWMAWGLFFYFSKEKEGKGKEDIKREGILSFLFETFAQVADFNQPFIFGAHF